jgi:hypothetical protein
MNIILINENGSTISVKLRIIYAPKQALENEQLLFRLSEKIK